MSTHLAPGALLIAESARAVLRAATLASPDTETGGLLVGCRITYNSKPFAVALYVTGPGPTAEHGHSTFAPDTVALQGELDTLVAAARDQGLAVGYMGEWHKHPAGYPELSESDVAQGRQILTDPSYSLPYAELILPVVTLSESDISIHAYLLTPALAQPAPLDVIVWDDDPLLALVREQTA